MSEINNLSLVCIYRLPINPFDILLLLLDGGMMQLTKSKEGAMLGVGPELRPLHVIYPVAQPRWLLPEALEHLPACRLCAPNQILHLNFRGTLFHFTYKHALRRDL